MCPVDSICTDLEDSAALKLEDPASRVLGDSDLRVFVPLALLGA
jgi:hypothetical protein